MSELRKKITGQFDEAVADIVMDDFDLWLTKKLQILEAEIIDQQYDCYGNNLIIKDDWQTAINRLKLSLDNNKKVEP